MFSWELVRGQWGVNRARSEKRSKYVCMSMSKWLSVTCNFERFFCKKNENVSSCEYDRWVVLSGHQTTGLQPNPTQLQPYPTKPNRSSVFPCLYVVGLQPNPTPIQPVLSRPNPSQPKPTKPQNNLIEEVCRNLALVGLR